MEYKDPGPVRSYERDQFWIETLVFLGVTAFMGLVFVAPVWKSLFVSVLLSILFYRVHKQWSAYIGNSFAALAIAIVALCIPIAPLIIGGFSAWSIATDLLADLQQTDSQTRIFVDRMVVLLDQAKQQFPILDRYMQNPSELLSEDGFVRQNLQSITGVAQSVAGTIYSSLVSIVFWVGVILFGVYYQLKAGDAPMRFARTIVPVRPEFVDATFGEFAQMTRAMIKVTLIVGFVQGGIGGFAMWYIGTPYWFLWTFLMVIFSMVPVAGAGVVLVPASLIYIFVVPEWAGFGQGIFLAVIFVVVSFADNIMKPYIVGGDSEMEPGFVLLSVVTGLIMFGAIGAFVGPIMFAFGLAYYHVYIKRHSERHNDYVLFATEQSVPVKETWQPLSKRIHRSEVPNVPRNRRVRK